MDVTVVMDIIGFLCTVLLTICMFILNKVDKNQTRLYQLHSELDHRVTIVETKCDIQHAEESGGRRPYDPRERIKTT